MPTVWTYRQDQETPSFAVNWQDRDRATIDMSTGYTFQVQLVNTTTGTIALTKTGGITGAATAPNVTVAWTTGELNLTPGRYRVWLKATSSGADRIFRPSDPPVIQITATPT